MHFFRGVRGIKTRIFFNRITDFAFLMESKDKKKIMNLMQYTLRMTFSLSFFFFKD